MNKKLDWAYLVPALYDEAFRVHAHAHGPLDRFVIRANHCAGAVTERGCGASFGVAGPHVRDATAEMDSFLKTRGTR